MATEAEKRKAPALPLKALLPRTAGRNEDDHLTLGGCDAVELAREFGTPLYVFDEADLRATCQEFLREFRRRHRQSSVVYAAKAYIGRALAALLAEEGLGLDVVSGGELAIARSVDFPMERVDFHGNNKSAQELREALEAGVGRIVVDNFHELLLLNDAAQALGRRQKVLLRVTPGVDPHTHAHISTGALDSKFGLPLAGGRAEEALVEALAAPGLEVVGLHCHVGSQIFEKEVYAKAIAIVVEFASRMRQRHGLELREFSPGGGFAIQYTREAPAPGITQYADTVVGTLKEECRKHSLPLPKLSVEPGRSLVGRAGVALYRVGSTKEVPGVRTYVAVDGGMADNIRPALYDAPYEALVANRLGEEPSERVTLAGKYCESGDVLVRDVDLPKLWAGDIIAIPDAGAYCLALASNYNCSLKPAIVMVKDGRARLVRRRETYEDLMRCDVFP